MDAKPCPFCGRNKLRKVTTGQVFCDCGANMEAYGGDTMNALAKWNNRAVEPLVPLDGLIIDVEWEGKTYSGHLTELSKKILRQRFGSPAVVPEVEEIVEIILSRPKMAITSVPDHIYLWPKMNFKQAENLAQAIHAAAIAAYEKAKEGKS